MVYRKYIVNDKIFEKINTKEKSYWLGFLYADGHNTEGKLWRVMLNLQNRDVDQVMKFRNFIYPNKDKPLYFTKNGKVVSLSVTNKNISQNLTKLGMVNRKSLTIDFPTNSIVPKHLILYFIQGIFDGDGSVSLTKTTKTPCACLDFCGSLKLIKKLKDVIKEETGINFGFKKRKYTNFIGVTYIKGNDKVLKFLNWLYKDSRFILKRKYQKYLDIKQIKNKIIENKSSKYRGVYVKRGHPYAQIQSGKNVYRLGRFKTEIEAAKAYNIKAIELFGRNTKLNYFI